MKKFLTILLVIMTTLGLAYAVINYMPIGINTKSENDLIKKSGLSFIFEGRTYKLVSMSDVFDSIRNSDIKCDYFKGENSCNLEYVYNGQAKSVYKSKYKKIINKTDPEEYLWFGDHYIVCFKKYKFFDSSIQIYSCKTLKMPDLKVENVEKIVKYIGVPDYDYYAENGTDFVNRLKADKDLYVIQMEEINDKSIIDTMLKERDETGSFKSFTQKETEKHRKEINEMQKRVNADAISSQQRIGSVQVYYKVYFKDQSFPFRLIFY